MVFGTVSNPRGTAAIMWKRKTADTLQQENPVINPHDHIGSIPWIAQKSLLDIADDARLSNID